MHFYSYERVGLFIDAENFGAAVRSLGLDIDFKRLIGYFTNAAHLTRTSYYALLPPPDQPVPTRPLLDWLSYNAVSVVSKTVYPSRSAPASMAVEIAVDALLMAPSLTHVVLFSGDANLRPAVQALQHVGMRVSVISTLKPVVFVDDELRRQADQFIELAEIGHHFERQRQTERGAGKTTTSTSKTPTPAMLKKANIEAASPASRLKG